jgi:hypothetical protein
VGALGGLGLFYGWWRLVKLMQRYEAFVYVQICVYRVSTLRRRLLKVFMGHYGPLNNIKVYDQMWPCFIH